MVNDHVRRAAMVGRICAEWSVLEYNIAIVIWRLLKLPDEDTGKIVTGGMDLLPRFNMAIALARHLKSPRQVVSALVSARKSIQDGLDIRRNRAIHGIHFLEPDGSTIVEMHRGKGSRLQYPATAADYEQLAEDISAVRLTLQRELHDAGLRWLPAAHIAK